MIHAQNDMAFKNASAPTKAYYSACGWGGNLHPVSLQPVDRTGKIIYPQYCVKDGKEDMLKFFLEFDPEYFENLAKTIEITSKTAAYITKTVQEIRETIAHRPKIVIGSHTERYLVEQSGNIVLREESVSQKDTVDLVQKAIFLGIAVAVIEVIRAICATH